jgi:hypothetical protein
VTYKAFYETSGVGVGVGGWLEVFCTNKAFHETSGVAGGVSAGMFNGVR